MSWYSETSIIPGHIPLIAQGRVENGVGVYKEAYIQKCNEAGFNILNHGLADYDRVIGSCKISQKYNMKLFMRFGFNKNNVYVGGNTTEELNKILPNYKTWQELKTTWVNCITSLLNDSLTSIPDPLDTVIGCMLDDEPVVSYFWGLSMVSHEIWNVYRAIRPSVIPFIFCNLLPDITIGKTSTDLDTQLDRLSGGLNKVQSYLPGYSRVSSYEDFVNQYQDLVNPTVLSFDSYPFKETIDGKPIASSMKRFFSSLIAYNNQLNEQRISFWSTVCCCKFEFNDRSGIIPSPTLGRLRFAAFASLLFGAKGISFWGVTPQDTTDGTPYESPFIIENKTNFLLTSTYYSLKTLNSQIKCFEEILLNSEIMSTVVTKTPPYITDISEIPGLILQRATYGIVASITGDRTGNINIDSNNDYIGGNIGFIVSHILGKEYLYNFIVSMDEKNSQSATFRFAIKNVDLLEPVDMSSHWSSLSSFDVNSGIHLTFSPGDIKIFRTPINTI